MKKLNLIQTTPEEREMLFERVYNMNRYEVETTLKKYGFPMYKNHYKCQVRLFLCMLYDRGENVRYMLSVPSQTLLKNASLKTIVNYLCNYQYGSLIAKDNKVIVRNEPAMIHWWIKDKAVR